MRTFTVAVDPSTDRVGLIADDGTLLLNVHPADACMGDHCIIHNPSAHHMRGWPLTWRDDRKMFERVCSHRVGHPDPDQGEYLALLGDDGVHGCCGCCVVPCPDGGEIDA